VPASVLYQDYRLKVTARSVLVLALFGFGSVHVRFRFGWLGRRSCFRQSRVYMTTSAGGSVLVRVLFAKSC